MLKYLLKYGTSVSRDIFQGAFPYSPVGL